MKCHHCGTTMVASAKSQGGHEFCSIDCSIRAAPQLQEEARIARHARSSHTTIPLLAMSHAAAPLLLFLLSRGLGAEGWAMAKIAVVLFWSWPVWLGPLIRYRHRRIGLFGIALVLSLVVWLAAALPMLGVAMRVSPGGIHV